MRYRIGLHPYSISEFGPVHTVDTNVPGGLGYTYPNPIQQRGKLWLFWRGGNWNPTFSYTRNGRRLGAGARARQLRRRRGPTRSTSATAATDPRDLLRRSPENVNNSLHYLRYENSGLYAAGGRKLGTLRQVPLHTSKLDHIYNYSSRGGRAWPHDIALDTNGRPHVVYTRRVGGRTTRSGTRTQRQALGQPQDRRRGPRATYVQLRRRELDHEDTRFIYLSRTVGQWNQVEQWFTPDHGRTWSTRQLTRPERLLDAPGDPAPDAPRGNQVCSSAAIAGPRGASPSTSPESTFSTSECCSRCSSPPLLAAPAQAGEEGVTRVSQIATLGPAHAAEHARARAEARAAPQLGQPLPAPACPTRPPTRSAVGLPATVGLPTFAINAACCPTGKVAFWGRAAADRRPAREPLGGLALDSGHRTCLAPRRAADRARRRRRAETPAPLFCSGQSLLADGQLFVAGGNLGNPAVARREHAAVARPRPRLHVRPVER